MRLGYGKRGSLELGCHLAPGLRRGDKGEHRLCHSKKRWYQGKGEGQEKREKKRKNESIKGGRERPILEPRELHWDGSATHEYILEHTFTFGGCHVSYHSRCDTVLSCRAQPRTRRRPRKHTAPRIRFHRGEGCPTELFQ